MELLKALNAGNTQGTIDARLSAQQATLDAMARALGEMQNQVATLSVNQADARLHQTLLIAAVACLILLLFVLIAWHVWHVEHRLKSLEAALGRDSKPDFIKVS